MHKVNCQRECYNWLINNFVIHATKIPRHIFLINKRKNTYFVAWLKKVVIESYKRMSHWEERTDNLGKTPYICHFIFSILVVSLRDGLLKKLTWGDNTFIHNFILGRWYWWWWQTPWHLQCYREAICSLDWVHHSILSLNITPIQSHSLCQ